MHICLNDDGYAYLRNITDEKDFKKIKIHKDNIYNFIKFNPLNENQFFVSSEKEFLIYDIKEGKELENIHILANCIDITMDSFRFIVTFKNYIKIFERNDLTTNKILKEYQDLSFSNVSCYNEKFDCMIVGNDNGDFLYSKKIN